MKLEQLKKEFEQYIVIKDKWVIDVVMATIVSNLVIPKDPVWTMFVAPSSGGKSTLIAPCSGVPLVHFLDDFTEKTLLSGYKVKGKEISLLKEIGSGILAFSDFTGILNKNPNSRGEVLTQLKMVYDGKFTKATGTGKSSWEGKMGFIGASTPDIYHLLEQGRSMGERFLYYWIEQPTDEEISLKQQKNTLSSKEVTVVMKDYYDQYIQAVSNFSKGPYGLPVIRISDEQKSRLRRAAKFCVDGKTTVHTNFKTGKVDQIPNKAGVGRDNKMFEALLYALQLMDAYEAGDVSLALSDERINLIEKCAYSSINRERRAVLEILARTSEPLTSSEIGAKEGLGISKEGAEIYITPLHAIGLIQKSTGGRGFKWFIENDFVKDFINRVSKSVKDNTPTAVLEVEEPHEDDGFEEWTKQADIYNTTNFK